jgi:hypothetical protein
MAWSGAAAVVTEAGGVSGDMETYKVGTEIRYL